MPTHIFFYGTLMTQHETPVHSSIATQLQFVRKATIGGSIYDMGRYPAFKPESNGTVYGELYKIIYYNVLTILDDYEKHDNEDPRKPGFSRTIIRAKDTLEPVWAYVYDGPVSDDALIPSGVWAKS